MANPNQVYVSINALSTTDRHRLRGVIQELNDSMTRAATEREYQTTAIKEINDALGVDKKVVRRMAKAYFKSNFTDEVESDAMFEEFYSTVMTSPSNP